MFVVVEGALRYGLLGAAAVALATLPFLAFVEWWRHHEFGGPGFIVDRVSFPFGILLFTGVIWRIAARGRLLPHSTSTSPSAHSSASCAASSTTTG